MLEFTSCFFVCIRSFFSSTCTYSTDLKYSWQKLDPCCARDTPSLVEGKEEGKVLHEVKWFPPDGRVVQWDSEDQDLSLHPKPSSHTVSWDVRICLVMHFRVKKRTANSYEHTQVTWEGQGGSRPGAVHQPTFALLEIGLHWGRSVLNSWLSANPRTGFLSPWAFSALIQCLAGLLLQRSCP